MMAEKNKNPELQKRLRRKTVFKYHALIYFVMNLLFWTMWYITFKNNPGSNPEKFPVPWPVWVMLGWGVALYMNYTSAYKKEKSG